MILLSEPLFLLTSLSNKGALQRFMLVRVDVQSGCIINRFSQIGCFFKRIAKEIVNKLPEEMSLVSVMEVSCH